MPSDRVLLTFDGIQEFYVVKVLPKQKDTEYELD